MPRQESQGTTTEGKLSKEVGKLVLTIEPEALRSIVASGRLLELADTLGKEAALQIAAQIVEHVAAAALEPNGIRSGVSASASFIFDGGDFGTVPPRPHWGVGPVREIIGASALRVVAGQEIQG